MDMRRILLHCLLPIGLLAASPLFAQSAKNVSFESLTGEKSSWNGFDRFDFVIDGKSAMVIVPHEPAPRRPWVLHGAFFGATPALDVALLGRGFHVVYLDIPDQFGSPKAIADWNRLYDDLTGVHGLAEKVALIGLSRGGLYAYNWAAANPGRVACIFGDAPVCDLKSWPLGRGQGTGNASEIPKLLDVYAVKSEKDLLAKAINPIDHLKPLADANIPLLHVYGDADTGVPWEENTKLLSDRYQQLGGSITLIAKPGVGHVHGLDDFTPVIDFIDSSCQNALADNSEPIEIGSRRELLVDRFLIERLVGDAHLNLCQPRDEGAVLQFDESWEGPQAGYATVIKDGDRYLLFYRGISQRSLDGSAHERICVAESRDGLRWTKPKVGIYEFQGSRDNNIVLADAAPATHNLCPMLDKRPGVPSSERFKALGGTPDKLFAFVSPDGFHWSRLRDEAVITKADVPIPHIHLFDSQNVPFWSEAEQMYVCYFRIWDGVRRIARTTSPDFVHWTPAVMMEQIHDDGTGTRPAPVEHLYTNQTSPYFRAPHIYVAIAARFFEGRQVLTEEQAKSLNVEPGLFEDVSDSVFMTSRGGHDYDRTFLEGYIKPGIGLNNWVSRTNYPALNLVQNSPTEMSLYVTQDYAQPTAHLRRYSLRLDGLASVQAGAAAGELVSKPLIFDGNRLHINFATSAGGELRIELQKADGEPLPGFTLADCKVLIGNEIDCIVQWKKGANLGSLAGQPIRIRCVLKDGDLFAFNFAP